ncbi:unnamed protein product, partial [Iphiclides podalirius]
MDRVRAQIVAAQSNGPATLELAPPHVHLFYHFKDGAGDTINKPEEAKEKVGLLTISDHRRPWACIKFPAKCWTSTGIERGPERRAQPRPGAPLKYIVLSAAARRRASEASSSFRRRPRRKA